MEEGSRTVSKEIVLQIARALHIRSEQVTVAIQLLEENTIPFIARYRKEQTQGLDEEKLRQVKERYLYLKQLEKRRGEIQKKIKEQGQLTHALAQKIAQASQLQTLEDLYLPYRPKRATRASIAREQGLVSLAQFLKLHTEIESKEEAKKYVCPDKNIFHVDVALQGAMDILAEELAENAAVRKGLREYVWNQGVLVVQAKDPTISSTYDMYSDYQEKLSRMPAHRILAINRGEKESFLKVKIKLDELAILTRLAGTLPKGCVNRYLEEMIRDSYKRLLFPTIMREIRAKLTEQAEEKSIDVFSNNLKHLLLQPPIKGKVVMGVDPAFRTGCKLAVVNETGKCLEVQVIYPTPPMNKVAEAKETFLNLCQQYSVEIVAIGNGTASRETELFVADALKEVTHPLHYMIVSEAGASVYSASQLAREEFPDLDVSYRSAISIARRVLDPLAELVKIDPKSVGVGLYQHDISEKKLSQSLEAVVESVVNYVGVNVNTASVELLQYVAGIHRGLAKKIVAFREKNGRFYQREEIQHVPRLGSKTYEQCIGFLRIYQGTQPLDQTAIHPESYGVARRLLKELKLTEKEIGRGNFSMDFKQVDVAQMAKKMGCGCLTLTDILASLSRPGRDPREKWPAPILRSDVLRLSDLCVGMHLQGIVRNVVTFGVFVDIGLKDDALIHISQLHRRCIRDPIAQVCVGEVVDVVIDKIDLERGRVNLHMAASVV